jgi:alanine racemase
MLSAAASDTGTTVGVHIKIDTGMHRVGVTAEEALDATRAIASLPGLEVEGAWSHLAVADVIDHPFTRKQLDLFADLVGRIERAGIELPMKHIANSAAAISVPDSRMDVVRCGVASYGLSPFADGTLPVDLRPALALRARANMVKTVAAGEALSYGLTYELPRTSRVITVPAGYADGYDRRLSGRADVLVRGRRFRVSGTVCMDQFMVDVSDADAKVGDAVTLIGTDGGDRVTAEELAGHIGTINYEVTSRVPSRVPRLYLNEIDG